MVRIAAVVVSAALVMSACANGGGQELTTGDENRRGDGAPTEPTRSHLTVFCGGVEFPGRSLDLSAYPVFEDDLADFVQTDFMSEFELQAEEGLLELTFYEVERTEDRIHLLAPAAEGSYLEVASERIDGAWRFVTWGGCWPQVEVEGFGISEMALDPDNEPTAASTSIDLLVTERECASGSLPRGREVAPFVFESAERVDIIVLIESTPGDVTCQGNPSFPQRVELDAPLGDREIRNIAFEPAVVLEWPIPPPPSETWIAVVGESPPDGAANVVTWDGSELPEGLVLDRQGWRDFGGGRLTGFVEPFEPFTISGFVGECGDSITCLDGACLMEADPDLEQRGFVMCDSLVPVGAECSVDVVYDPSRNTIVTVTYENGTCSIETSSSPLG